MKADRLVVSEKLIITCAITGSIHTPTMTPYLPITPEQIADEAVKACQAGAAIVHIHARDPKTGAPSADINLFRAIISKIKKESDVVICITTGGGLGMSIEERVRVVPEFKPEMASFNMGSMNFALYPVVAKFREFKHDWEKRYLEMTEDFVFRNTFKELKYICATMKANGTKPELECYDVGHLYNAAQLIQEGALNLPIHIQFVMGILGGIGTAPEDLTHMKHTADRLFGNEYTWSALAAGRAEFPLCTLATTMGGHVRVGLEDNLYLEKGVLAKSNAELVKKMAKVVTDLTGREIATPDDARQMLRLKGKDKVNF